MEMELDTKGMNCPMPILKAKKANEDIEMISKHIVKMDK